MRLAPSQHAHLLGSGHRLLLQPGLHLLQGSSHQLQPQPQLQPAPLHLLSGMDHMLRPALQPDLQMLHTGRLPHLLQPGLQHQLRPPHLGLHLLLQRTRHPLPPQLDLHPLPDSRGQLLSQRVAQPVLRPLQDCRFQSPLGHPHSPPGLLNHLHNHPGLQNHPHSPLELQNHPHSPTRCRSRSHVGLGLQRL